MPKQQEKQELVEFVHSEILPLYHRDGSGQYSMKWCASWLEHHEAVMRFTALQQAHQELVANKDNQGTGLSTWIKDHLDTHMQKLLDQRGTFAECTLTTHTTRQQQLPSYP